MTTREHHLTHKGWLAFCPVYFGGLESDEPLVVEREWVPVALLFLAIWFQQLSMFVIELFNDEYEGHFMLHITGELTR